jgi:hypothetical protein
MATEKKTEQTSGKRTYEPDPKPAKKSKTKKGGKT